MNALKYFKNKKDCPLCKAPLKHDKSSFEVYCSHCGLVVRDFDPNNSDQLNIIFYLMEEYNL